MLLLLICVGCCCCGRPCSESYRQQYSYLYTYRNVCHQRMQESEYFLVFLVQARHLDYTENKSFLKSIAKHPSDGTKNSDVGHAWIYLQGMKEGQPVYWEGGHSGERGELQPRYFEGVIQNLESGCDANPISYLWACQRDGFFQEGNGGHNPTYAAKIDLTSEQFHDVLDFVENYNFEEYYLTDHQCASFVTKVAERVGVSLENSLTIEIQPEVQLSGEWLHLWQDPRYRFITLCSPDVLEESLMRKVYEGQLDYALDWYSSRFREKQRSRCDRFCETWVRLPSRVQRLYYFR